MVAFCCLFIINFLYLLLNNYVCFMLHVSLITITIKEENYNYLSTKLEVTVWHLIPYYHSFLLLILILIKLLFFSIVLLLHYGVSYQSMMLGILDTLLYSLITFCYFEIRLSIMRTIFPKLYEFVMVYLDRG